MEDAVNLKNRNSAAEKSKTEKRAIRYAGGRALCGGAP